ncbi:hypothetical protein ACJMK2_021851, partial [Sinanodonta woodiana]
DVPLPLYSPRDYHDFLDQQVIEKRKNQKLAEMEGKRQAVQHVQTFENNMFGKYGGGAPKGRDLRKKKLDYSIHHPSDEREFNQNYNDYRKVVEDEITAEKLERLKPRTTIHSNHANLYDFPDSNVK